MPGCDRIGGSPQPDPCANTRSGETATSSSAPDGISAPEKSLTHTTGPVPLYLIPQALSTEIHEHRDGIIEVRIRRTRYHQYLITLLIGRQEAAFHA
ncbi:MAG TPA: hypothetical protein PK069_07355 [Methanolinea sp.]|nr:hypothetical protein [Methanolinea sp.]HQK56075.1 hypothetical protein [Methanolinea sp.]